MSKETVSIPYYVAEGMSDRLSATNKRLWILCILLIILLVGSNALWVIYENSFEDYVVTQESEELRTVYTPPQKMLEKWDADHKKYIEKAAWIKQMLAM